MELDLYSNIEYTAAWYYRNFPGFYNIDCYKILADFSQNPYKHKIDSRVEESKHTEEEQEPREEERQNKKIRLDNRNKNGLWSKHRCFYTEDFFIFFRDLYRFYLLSIFYFI